MHPVFTLYVRLNKLQHCTVHNIYDLGMDLHTTLVQQHCTQDKVTRSEHIPSTADLSAQQQGYSTHTHTQSVKCPRDQKHKCHYYLKPFNIHTHTHTFLRDTAPRVKQGEVLFDNSLFTMKSKCTSSFCTLYFSTTHFSNGNVKE